MKEVNFVDRVSTHAGRMFLSPVEGMPDTFTLTRADEPTVEGTPIDKATFNSIIHSRLTGRYYTPTVSKLVKNKQTLKTNPIPASGWVMDSTGLSGTSGSYMVEANSLHASSYTPEKALDGNTNTDYRSDANGEITLKITFPAAIAIKKYKLAMRPDNFTYDVTTYFEGSNNGTAWTTLYSTTTKTDNLTEFTLSSTGEFTQYRLRFVASETGINVHQFEVSEYDVAEYTNQYVLSDGVPTSWDKGQRIFIQTPQNVEGLAVTSNTLNGKTITTILQALKRYELIYNGTAFDAKGV